MLSKKNISLFLTSLTMLVWFVNGLFCKILNFVPRHQEIVEKILNITFNKEMALYAPILTKMIGFAELVMVVWILSHFRRNLCAYTQIFIVILMNIIEFLLAPELLLFGKINIFVAITFATLVYYDNFSLQLQREAKTDNVFVPLWGWGLLRNSPFAVQAHFDSSIVLTFAAPQEQLKHLIPPCLELDMFEDEEGKKWAFIAVAMVQTKELRPKGFPTFLGNDFFLIGFRVFVRYTTNAGKRLRGLYILRSETDKKKMQVLGNFFTKYKYVHTDINLVKTNTKNHTENTTNIKITSDKSDFFIEVERKNNVVDNSVDNPAHNLVDDATIKLPENSPFKDWKQARRFAGPLPFTFSYNAKTNNVTIVEGVREDWTPAPVSVLQQEIGFLKTLNIKDLVLASAFVVENIPYFWKKGRIEQWK